MDLNKFKGIIEKVPGKDKIQNIVKTVSGKGGEGKALSNAIKDKHEELDKTYRLIGMEVYDLIKDQKYDIPQIKGYMDKVDDLSAEIERLEIESAAASEGGSMMTCSCGALVNVNSKFCPNCGKPVQPAVITCSCGEVLAPGIKFCNRCGKKVELVAADTGMTEPGASMPEAQAKQCLCGAMIPAGQTICFECGRKVQ